jgi:hypothetical protein
MDNQARERKSEPDASHMARLTPVAFLLTFICARCVVFLIMARTIPDLYMHARGTPVHPLHYGIFPLSGLGADLLFTHAYAGKALDPKIRVMESTAPH